MAGSQGWYVARQLIPGQPHAGMPATYVDVVFYWPKATPPTVNNVDVTDLTAIVGGPYKTQAQAEKVVAADKNTTGQPGIGPPGGRGGGQVTPGSAGGSLPNPFASIEAFFRVVTDGKLWRSMGWILLGALFIFLGLTLWLKQSAGQVAGQVASVIR